MTDPILEAAAQALAECGFYDNESRAAAKTMLAAVTPLIEAAALERAAKMAENHIFYSTNFGPPLKQLEEQIAAAIRTLKEQAEPRTDCNMGYVRYGACTLCGADAIGDCRGRSNP